MRVFIYDQNTDGRIGQLCREAGLEVWTPERVRRKRLTQTGDHRSLLDQMDLLIMEVTHAERDALFLLAQALVADKPTLCLYIKNKPPRELLDIIKEKAAPRPIKTFSYTESSVDDAVKHFINLHDEDAPEKQIIPSIKFTLRLTPRIDDYLSWLRDKHGMNKADYLRDLFTRMAEEDEEYQKRQRD